MINQNSDSGTAGKQLIGMLIGVAIIAGIGFGAQQLFFKPKGLDIVMMEAASEINKTCPIMVDQDTRLDNTVALPNKVFQYNYSLVNWTRDEVSVDTLKKYLEPAIVNTARSSPGMKAFRDNKVTMSYHYKDRNGVFVHQFTVLPEQYAAE